jgi:multidrug transporter EmrE-like cation transporter
MAPRAHCFPRSAKCICRIVIPLADMTYLNFSLILTGVLLNAGAQLLLKGGTNQLGVIAVGEQPLLSTALRTATEPHIVSGLGCYVVSVAIWIMALSRVEVSIAYPMLSIGYVVNALAAYYLFGESFTAAKIAGIGVIILGVVLLAKS